MRRVAKLNAQGHLIADMVVEDDAPLAEDLVDMDPGDLPLDGTYKWDARRRTFVPLGHGFERVAERAPVNEAYVLYHMARALRKDMPQDVRDWVAWYERNLKQRDDERALRARRLIEPGTRA